VKIPQHSFDSFGDVAAALAASALSLDGVSRPGEPRSSDTARESIPPGEIARLEPTMSSSARAMARALTSHGAVDLAASFAVPWSLELALAYAAGAGAKGSHEAGVLEANARVPLMPTESERLVELARTVFNEAAHATSRVAATESSCALLDLVRSIGSNRSPLVVQGFVALANTLPLLLTGAWHALVMHPGAWQSLRRTPAARASATDELLRLASPARVVFRRAVADVTIGTTRVAAGDELLLALHDANRCPEHFHDPEHFIADRFATGSSPSPRSVVERQAAERLVTQGAHAQGALAEDLVATRAVATRAVATRAVATRAVATRAVATRAVATRAVATGAVATGAVATGAVVDGLGAGDSLARSARCRHVGLGLHPHACAGAALVRVALDIATSALLDEFDQVALAGPVTWLGGFAIDGITSLPVTLQRARDPEGGEGTCRA